VVTQHLTLTALESHQGQRVDSFVALLRDELSRARVQALLLTGHIRVNGKPVAAKYRMKSGDVVEVELPAPRPMGLIAENIPLDVLFADEDIVVINKPAGLVVHPGAGNQQGTLLHALLFHFPDMHVAGVERPGLVHRLDKETSGVLVCARNDAAFEALQKQFKARGVKKLYRAFAIGAFASKTFELRTGHVRHTHERWRYSTKVKPPISGEREGHVRLAHSQFEVVQSAGGVSELVVNILTGRTHQIRAHLADIHHPLVQDSVYGGMAATKKLPAGPVREAALLLSRHALHAERLAFMHPTKHERVEFHAPLPQDLLSLKHAIARA
jgi:23S rRNA pseudouridine1911/1915/1917 synthase